MDALKLLLAAALFVSFSGAPAFAYTVPADCKDVVGDTAVKNARALHKMVAEKVKGGETVSAACLKAAHVHGAKEAAPAEGGAAAPEAPAPAKP